MTTSGRSRLLRKRSKQPNLLSLTPWSDMQNSNYESKISVISLKRFQGNSGNNACLAKLIKLEFISIFPCQNVNIPARICKPRKFLLNSNGI